MSSKVPNEFPKGVSPGFIPWIPFGIAPGNSPDDPSAISLRMTAGFPTRNPPSMPSFLIPPRVAQSNASGSFAIILSGIPPSKPPRIYSGISPGISDILPGIPSGFFQQ